MAIKFLSPGIMGYFSFFPKMECNHGVLSFDHMVYGSLNIDDKLIDFSHGKGYIEKDWGKSFPEAYIWMQSNHFISPNISFTGSIAIIPWLKNSFIGFIFGLYINKKLYKFTTYSNTKIKNFHIDSSKVILDLEDKKYSLNLIAENGITGDLMGPAIKEMNMRVSETLNAKFKITLKQKNTNTIIFNETGYHGGMEIVGNLDKLQKYLSFGFKS